MWYPVDYLYDRNLRVNNIPYIVKEIKLFIFVLNFLDRSLGILGWSMII